MEGNPINIRFYYRGYAIKSTRPAPLIEEVNLTILEDNSRVIKFKYRFAVLSGGAKQELLFVVFTPESEHE